MASNTWTEVAGPCWNVCVLCIPMGLSLFGCSFLLSSRISHGQNCAHANVKLALCPILFSNISITLEQICLFSTSVIADWLYVPIHTFTHLVHIKGPIHD